MERPHNALLPTEISGMRIEEFQRFHRATSSDASILHMRSITHSILWTHLPKVNVARCPARYQPMKLLELWTLVYRPMCNLEWSWWLCKMMNGGKPLVIQAVSYFCTLNSVTLFHMTQTHTWANKVSSWRNIIDPGFKDLRSEIINVSNSLSDFTNKPAY